MKKIGRNQPCYCGSGKKYKKCHLGKKRELPKIIEDDRPEPYLDIVPSVEFKGRRVRAIWNKVILRPLKETFQEFLLFVLKDTLGQSWVSEQLEIDSSKRHIVFRWFDSCKEWMAENQTPGNKIIESGREIWSAVPSGDVQSLIQFAYDIYCLQIVDKLPGFMVKKLRNFKEFQGVRYEITVAAIIARAGFEIIFLDETIKDKPHCEFIAKHKETGLEVAVEAKSRHRRGVLHEEGSFNYNNDIKGDIQNLFKDALKQKLSGMPFIIFIDLNLPSSGDIPLEKRPWFEGVSKALGEKSTKENPDQYSVLILTNFAYYYTGNTGVTAKGEYCFIISKYTDRSIEPKILQTIWNSIERYSHIPKEV